MARRKSAQAKRRSAAAKKGWATRRKNARSAAAKKGWATRRAKQVSEAPVTQRSPVSSQPAKPTYVPLTPREAKERDKQRELAHEERERLAKLRDPQPVEESQQREPGDDGDEDYGDGGGDDWDSDYGGDSDTFSDSDFDIDYNDEWFDELAEEFEEFEFEKLS